MEDSRIDLTETIQQVLEFVGVPPVEDTSLIYQLTSMLMLFGAAFIVWMAFRLIVLIKLPKLLLRGETQWADDLYTAGFFRRFANLMPGIFLFYANPWVHDPLVLAYKVVYYTSSLYIIIVSYMMLQSLLSGIELIYKQTRFANKSPITGFIQVARLLATIVLIFLIVSLLMGQSPIYLLSGLTAIAAVLILVFRDTILGFVSGIQIAANRMFNTGDWIEMPKYGIDGEIQEIGLTIVKVQNWDKTISTIPTYALTTDAVKNWRGMTQTKGRRIKRAILIDIESVDFATPEQIQNWQKLSVLQPYLSKKSGELSEDRTFLDSHKLDPINSRRLTNVGTFRAYIEAYLMQHKGVRQDLTLMVRQLKPSEVGLPIEVYCFSAEFAWVSYEHLQADIFDHILAIMPLFDLRVYQRVTNYSQSENQKKVAD